MTRRPRTVIATLLVLAMSAGCDAKEAEPAAPVPTPSPAASVTGCEPMVELASLDTRQPVPLQPMMAWHQKQNMMQHLLAIQRITAGLADEDWEEIARASALIETSPQMQQMCEHMGAGADGFTEMALEFHRRADTIGEAARARDGIAVLRATSNTLQSCTGCHTGFRQEVVDSATWEARTGQALDAGAPSTLEEYSPSSSPVRVHR